MNLNQVTIPVTQMKKSIKFYTQLGLTLIVHTHDRYARFVCPDGNASLSLHLVESIAEGPRSTVYFEEYDLDKYVNKLIDKGLKFDQLSCPKINLGCGEKRTSVIQMITQ